MAQRFFPAQNFTRGTVYDLLIEGDCVEAAKFPRLMTQRYHGLRGSQTNGLWGMDDIVAYNPNIKVTVYMRGNSTIDYEPGAAPGNQFSGTIERYDFERAPPTGDLETDNRAMLLTHSSGSEVCTYPGYPNDKLLYFGNADLREYMKTCITTDHIGKPWMYPGHPGGPFGHFYDNLTFYPNGWDFHPEQYTEDVAGADQFDSDLIDYMIDMTAFHDANNMYFMSNMGGTWEADKSQAWKNMSDQFKTDLPNPPNGHYFMCMEEGGFAVNWGLQYNGARYRAFPDSIENWERMLETFQYCDGFETHLNGACNLAKHIRLPDYHGNPAALHDAFTWVHANYLLFQRASGLDIHVGWKGGGYVILYPRSYDLLETWEIVGDTEDVPGGFTGMKRRQFNRGWIYANVGPASVVDVPLPADHDLVAYGEHREYSREPTTATRTFLPRTAFFVDSYTRSAAWSNVLSGTLTIVNQAPTPGWSNVLAGTLTLSGSATVPTPPDYGDKTSYNGVAVNWDAKTGWQYLVGDEVWSATGLPTGLSMAPSTGIVTGTPSANGGYTVTVTANDGTAYLADPFTWTIQDVPPAPDGGAGAMNLNLNLMI